MLIALMTIGLLINNIHADEVPPLPELPKVENVVNQEIINKNIPEEQTTSFFKRFFGIKKLDPELVKPKEPKSSTPATSNQTNNNKTEQVEDLPPLDNKKLPALENIPEHIPEHIPEKATIPTQLDNPNNNLLDIIKNKDSENIDNLIPALPVNFPENLDSTVPSPLLKETLPPLPFIPEEKDDRNQSMVPDQLPVVTPNQDKVPTPQLETESDKKELPLPAPAPAPVPLPAEKSPSSINQPPAAILPAPLSNDGTIPTTKSPTVEDTKKETGSSGDLLSPPAIPAIPEPEAIPPIVPSAIPNLEGNKNEEAMKPKEVAAPLPPTAKTLLDQAQTPNKQVIHTPIPVFVKETQQADVEHKYDTQQDTHHDTNYDTNHDIKQDIRDENPSTKIPKIPPISKPELPTKTNLTDLPPVDNFPAPNISKNVSPGLGKFIQDEIQMLLYQNDDLVLGVLTEEARIEQMDIHSFIKLCKQLYDRQKRAVPRKKINNFIANYTKYFHTKQPWSDNMVIDQAFAAIKKNNVFDLKVILDNFSILQKSGINGYTLLHEAASWNHYYIAKLLIIRGINIKVLDDQCNTALAIAEQRNNNVACLIRKATGIKQANNLCKTSRSVCER